MRNYLDAITPGDHIEDANTATSSDIPTPADDTNLTPAASDTTDATPNTPTGNDIADAARGQIGSLNYKTYGYSFDTPSGQPKDGPFIANTLDNAGVGFGPTPPAITDWANPKASIPGWSPVTDGSTRTGDVLATSEPMPLDWYRGGGQQLGIVSGQGTSIGITDNDRVNESDFGFRDGHNPVVWRNDQVAASAGTGTGATTGPSAPSSPAPDRSTPPAYQASVFQQQPGAWDKFNAALDRLPGASDTEKFVYGQTYGAEGGNAVDPASGASSGILRSTLGAAQKAGVPGLAGITDPKDLNADQRAQIMRWNADQAFRTVDRSQPGHNVLDAIGDPYAAAALHDTMYRFGNSGGAEIVQQAINDVQKGRVVQDGQMGPGVLQAYREMVQNPATRPQVLDKLGDERSQKLQDDEVSRNEYFRFRSTW